MKKLFFQLVALIAISVGIWYGVEAALSMLDWDLITNSVLDEDRISSDTVYSGSLTFAGLVLFGSALLGGINKIPNKPRGRYWGAFLMLSGAYIMSLSHVTFAFMYGYIVVLLGQSLTLGLMATWSATLIMMATCGFILFIRSSRENYLTDGPE